MRTTPFVVLMTTCGLLGLSACSIEAPDPNIIEGPAGEDGLDGLSAVYTQTPIEPGETCEAGGVQVDIGMDNDGDGALDLEEINQTYIVCNGANGADGENGVDGYTALVDIAEADTETCELGGYTVSFWYDFDGDGTMAESEVVQSVTICNGQNGADGADGATSIVTLTDEPAGENCENGGVLIESGVDDDGDGSLSESEVDSSAYVCNGVDGEDGEDGTSVVSSVEDADSTECPDGGYVISMGQDDDGDGELDESEIDETIVICDGEDGADGEDGEDGEDGTSVLFSVEDADSTECANGGYIVSFGYDDDGDGSLSESEVDSELTICNGEDGSSSSGSDGEDGSSVWWPDSDGDGWGVMGPDYLIASTQPSGYVLLYGDCDDGDTSANPGETEVEDGVDNDCNGTVDDGTDAYDDDGDGYSENDGDCDDADPTVTLGDTYFADVDLDGYGDESDAGSAFCSDPGSGYSVSNDDCDDSDSSANPGETEVEDGVDNDCNGLIDDGTDAYDDDGDGYSENDGDCDDADPTVTLGDTYFADVDLDGYGDESDAGSAFCSDPGSGYSSTNDDCDDSDSSANPGESEVEDGVDNDCNGLVDDGTDDYDDDGDGETENEGDCDDTDASVNTSASEVCDDGIDNDCDTDVDEVEECGIYLSDEDGDGVDDTVWVSVTFMTSGALYQDDAYVTGDNSYWDWELLSSEIVSATDGYFEIDTSPYSVGVEHQFTLVSSFASYDIDGDGDVDTDDTLEYGFDFDGDGNVDNDEEGDFNGDGSVDDDDNWLSATHGAAVWIQNYTFCTSGSDLADQVCALQDGDGDGDIDADDELIGNYLWSITIDSTSGAVEFSGDGA